MTELEIAELITRRRRQLLVHSIIYYRLNDNIISDYTWSEWAKELCDLQSKYPEIAEKCYMHEDFKDFDGSTGFNLPLGEPCALNKAQYLLKVR
jgi:NAD-dependent DNA ligase